MQNVKNILSGEHPILERFKEVCPGTYKHCQNVSELCDVVGKELKADLDILVTSALLHDIGKMNNSNYFSENQMDATNPHDDLEPQASYHIITKHVGDGVIKLIQLDMPKPVIRVVSEHHGDSIVKSIYNKAKDKYNGSTVEDHYRYKSCKPSSLESAILMCADSVEATTRSIANAGKLKDCKEVIYNIIDKLVEDEQIDILTIGQLRIIKKVLCKEIESIFHKRVDYDEKIEEQ